MAALALLVWIVPAKADGPPATPLLRLETGMHVATISSVDVQQPLVLTTSWDKTAELWSLDNGSLTRVFRPPIDGSRDRLLAAGALSPDGSTAAVGGYEAVQKRIAFTDFITNTVLPPDQVKAGIGSFIKLVPDLIKALTDAGISIWREFHTNGEARRTALRDELEALRWPPFKS